MSTRSLPRLAFLVLLLVGLVALTGCIKSEEATKVGSDGKGRTNITMIVDMAKVRGAQEMLESMGMGGGGEQSDQIKELTPTDFKERFEGIEGVRVISADHQVDKEKDTVTLKAVLEFDSLETLYKSGAIERVDVKLEKLEDGNYKFTRQPSAREMPDMSNPEAAAMMEGYLSMFEPFIAELEMAFEITLPTAVIETSGEIIGVNKVRWALGFKDLMDAKKRTQTVVFGGEGISWKPFAATAAEIQALKEKRKAAPTTPSEKDGEGEPEKPTPDEDAGK